MLKIILTTLIFILSFIILSKIKFKNKGIIRIILIVLMLEFYIFNFNSLRTELKQYEEKEYTPDEVVLNDIEYNEEQQLYIVTGDNPNIQIKDINADVATIKTDIELVNVDKLEYSIYYTDKTSKYYRQLPSKVLVNNLERSQYVTCYLSGESNKIRVRLNAEEDTQIKINAIEINKSVPMNFSIMRVGIISGIIILIYEMVTSRTFNMPYDEKNNKQMYVILGIVVAFILILSWEAGTSKITDKIYLKFVDSLMEGSLSLKIEPPQELGMLENPYDTTQRLDIEYIWDTAYYDNSYFVYFGILPALILYIPVKILTGANLPIHIGVLLFSILTVINLCRIIISLYKKWFRQLNFNYLILAIIGTLSGSFLFWINRRPMVYELVTIAGICFLSEGTYLMLKALNKEDEINYKDLTLSTLCLALSVACRPNHLLVSLIFVPKLLQILIKNIKEKRNVTKYIAAVCIPYLIIGVLLMIYNYIRFDSIFEFGTSYQLTANDMNNLENRLATIPVGIITQLFKLPVTSNEFPFFIHQNETISFFGYYYVESLVCGLFILNPINLILLFLIKLKKKIKEKEAYDFACVLTIVSIIICILNIVLAGTLQRYSMDYAWLLNIASYITLFIIVSNIKSEEIKKYILKIAIGVTVFMLIANFIIGAVVSEKNVLEILYPEKYYSIRYGICFWE